MSHHRRISDAERTEVRRVLDQLAEHASARHSAVSDCRPGIRGACRRPGCTTHQPSTDREEGSPQAAE